MREHNPWKETNAPCRLGAFYSKAILSSKKQHISNQRRKINSRNHCRFLCQRVGYTTCTQSVSTAEQHNAGKHTEPDALPKTHTFDWAPCICILEFALWSRLIIREITFVDVGEKGGGRKSSLTFNLPQATTSPSPSVVAIRVWVWV